jgi:hypothetical protein
MTNSASPLPILSVPLSRHPILGSLRSIREPHGRTLEVVEALCRRAKPPARPEAGWRPKMPSDDEIAAALRISTHTVRTHISTVANWIEGLEEFDPRVRIYIWYWHREWEKTHAPAPR